MVDKVAEVKEGQYSAVAWKDGDRVSVTFKKSWKKQGAETWEERKISMFKDDIDKALKVLNEIKTKL